MEIKTVSQTQPPAGLFLPVFVALAVCNAGAADPGSRQAYDRVHSFRELTAGKVYRTNIRPRWLKGGREFWYRVQIGPDEFRFVFVNAVQGEKREAFDHERLADALAKAAQQPVDAARLPFRTIRFTSDASAVRFTAFGRSWNCDLESYELSAGSEAETDDTTVRRLDRIRRSRDGGEETYVRFVNRTNGPVNLIWITPSRNRRHYEIIDAGKEHHQHTYARHVWLVTDANDRPLAVFEAVDEPGTAIIDGKARVKIPEARRPDNPDDGASPDGRWHAFIRNHNLFLRDPESDEEIALTEDGTEDDRYLGPIRWSPDSAKLIVVQERQGDEREVHLIESAPRDRLQPKLHTLRYAKPGDRLRIRRPRLFDVEQRKHVPIANDLFSNPWSISDLRWQPDSGRFTFLYNQRGHQVLRTVAVDAATGQATTLIDETSSTFIDYAGKSFTRYLDDTHEIIRMSERDGWNHLYLYDSRTGELKTQITRGPWVVRGIDRVDEAKRQIWFRAGGFHPDQDPYYIHYCRVNFDGSDLVALTSGNGTHSIDISPNGDYLIDTWSRVDLPPVTELRRTDDGTLVCELERGDWSALLATGWQPPERFVAKGRDGKTDIYGVLYRPTNFDPDDSYPVIEKIYAGPHGSFVPKRFSAYRSEQANAELGFVVVQIDGMGTSHRSKAFHDVCWQNLGDSGFPDRMLWMKAAAKKYPAIDLSRVGIYGGSAGGQSALRALLAHGDFYKVAVADCGCHDNRMDKVWWNELWMGWPVGPHYAEQSNVTNAHRLEGKLLLTVGELDRNVDPTSTMQVVDALIKADKDFDLLVVPGAGHGVGETPYCKRRRRDFFVRHLLGVEPRREP